LRGFSRLCPSASGGRDLALRGVAQSRASLAGHPWWRPERVTGGRRCPFPGRCARGRLSRHVRAGARPAARGSDTERKGHRSRWSGPRGRKWSLRRRPVVCPGKTRRCKRRS